jgi:phosphoribosyl-AMP cyclohydrolase
MPHLILIRHANPQIDPQRPARDWPLSAEGRARCQALARRLACFEPQVVVSSVEPKALETAQIVAQCVGLDAETAAGLHEHERDNVAFTSREPFEAQVAAFFAQPHALVFGRESADAAHRRFSTAVQEVLARHAGRNLAIVTHGTVLSLFVTRAAGLEPFPFWRSLGLPALAVLSLPDLKLLHVLADLDAPPALRWDERGLLPVVVQDAATHEVLMVAWMNAESLRRTRETGEAWFWSRARRALWRKGATSGHVLRVREIRADCDGDTLLLRVQASGPACHTGARSCFFQSLSPQ